jgi:hypothetical protein
MEAQACHEKAEGAASGDKGGFSRFSTVFALRPAANDSYGEVRVGGLNTACLSRDGLARLMLQDCPNARADNRQRPKLVFASNGHTIALAARDEGFRATNRPTSRCRSCSMRRAN